MDPHTYLEELFLKALDTCSPSCAIEKSMNFADHSLTIDNQSFDIRNQPLAVLSVGKASVPMYEATAKVLGERIGSSLVITSDNEQAGNCSAEKVISASHPTPDKSSLRAGKTAVTFFKEVPENAIVLMLISGGTSSLMAFPAEDIPIFDLTKTFRLLNNSGATIYEINSVRKHCSQIKGGQLLRYLNSNATLVDVVISDVPNDDLSIIGSGPTTPDTSTFGDAHHILQKYNLWKKVPETVKMYIKKGISQEADGTVKPQEDLLDQHYAHIISSAGKFAQTVAELASEDDINSRIAEQAYNENVQKIASQVTEQISHFVQQNKSSEKSNPLLFIFYGESTVEVTGSGMGGRNQELALRGALKIDGLQQVTWLSAGTDGIDGPTDAAGAIVDGTTISQSREQGIYPKEYLANNDSYHFHEKMGTLLKTGATGNNMMDVVWVLIGK